MEAQPDPQTVSTGEADISEEIETLRQDIRELNEKWQTGISEISEMSKMAHAVLEKRSHKQRTQKSILSIYNRCPAILEEQDVPIVTTDADILQRQLDLLEQRKQGIKSSIEELERKQSDLEANRAEVERLRKRENELIAARSKEKAQLLTALKREVEESKKLYMADGRTIDKKLVYLNQSATELNPEFQQLRQAYDRLNGERREKLMSVPQEIAERAKSLEPKRQELIVAVTNFIDFWSNRRMLRHYRDLKDWLDGILRQAEERKEESMEMVKGIEQSNAERNEELDAYKEVIEQRRKEKEALEVQIGQLTQEVEKWQSEKRECPPDDAQKIEQLKRQERELLIGNRRKREQLARLAQNEEALAKKFVNRRRAYLAKLTEVGELEMQIEEKRKTEESKARLDMGKNLDDIADILGHDVIVAEEQDYSTIQVASLDVLASFLFNPANLDPYYNVGMLVLMHTEDEITLEVFCQKIIQAYESTEFVVTRSERLSALMKKWREWFAQDFTPENTGEGSRLKALLDYEGARPAQAEEEQTPVEMAIMSDEIPLNEGSATSDFVMAAAPMILAEHLTYHELKILNEILPYEFIGAGWTTVDKWTRSPHIVRMTEHFNNLTHYITQSIVTAPQLKTRVELIVRWIRVMSAAEELRNYQLVFEIMSSLSSAPVGCMKVAWGIFRNCGKYQSEIDIESHIKELTSITGRFKAYREQLAKESASIVVPYIGPMLTSLVYIADGNPRRRNLPESHEPGWNFQKYRSYAIAMTDVCRKWAGDMQFIVCQELMNQIDGLSMMPQREGELLKIAKKNNGQDEFVKLDEFGMKRDRDGKYVLLRA